MLIRRFVLKVINNEIKDLTHHEITGCIAEQTVLVITQGCKESKNVDSFEITTAKFVI